MSEKMQTCAVQMEEDEEDSRATPERPPFSPIGSQISNEKDKDTHMPTVKTESIDIVEQNDNNRRSQEEEITPPTQTQETSKQEANKMPANTNDNQEVRVKAEPDLDEAHVVDYDMPLSKTPEKEHASTAAQSSDLETTRLLSNFPTVEAVNGNTFQMPTTNSVTDNTAKSALDVYLDGLATPIAPVRPRLRVKTEFSLIPPTPRREPSPQPNSLKNQSDSMETDQSPPPPPPLISSVTTTDGLADGIATPRISLAAINRLRVKNEFSTPVPDYNEDSSSLPSDYFNDLLETRETKRESGEVSSHSEDDSEDENIPADFFDDLLQDKLKERIEEARNNELEEKFSERLKELKRLQKEKRKKSKKQKKSKKKSRKRSRSRSASPSSNRMKEKQQQNVADSSNHDKIKRSRNSPPSHQETNTKAVTSSVFNREYLEDCLRVDQNIRVKTETSISDLDNNLIESGNLVENVEEIEEVLTPKQKRERAIKRATALLQHLKDTAGAEESNIFSSFPFVSTVRKLPTSHSYVQQQIYENRSPLHTINNVSYKFNSHTTRFNMEEWGLAALPTHAAKVAKLIGCDAQFIHTKLKTIKIPAKLKKVKQESGNKDQQENDEEEELIETSSSLYCNAMTQTDDLEEFDMQRKTKGYDIAIQVEPSVYSIGCQTLETQSPTENMHQDDDSPIMNIIRDLNENQLMAIHQFAELIRQPNVNASNAMEMYKIQMQIVEIYKISQIPSALATTQTQTINNYTTTCTTNTSPSLQRGNVQTPRESNQLTIQSVRGADGTQFSINDPRAKSAVYSQRIAKNTGAGSSSSTSSSSLSSSASTTYDSRYSAFAQPSHHGRSSPHETYSQGRSFANDNGSRSSSHQRQYGQKSQPPLPTTTKFYGRGGLRR
ncbi:hypothetical protein FF38_08239 [Lucilia cuprina]|uniref:Protein panoramix n=1 Tax=Lucilia cuprina TaxID=7375 RepID=A0A0L0BYS9_LUCCU|nr:Protein panoramix [Lucilia cuprina]KNC25180.1 hypothetical protein FF38_08239 [Lucilia cuprina]